MKDKELNQEYLRKTGIENVGKVPWGTHFCQFYQNQDDLISILVPYFKAGLENNEFCMWITAEPLMAEQAEQALRKEIPGLDAYIKNGQIEILDYNNWYAISGRFDSERVLQGWIMKEKQALQKGFAGLRLSGNTFWLEKKDWKAFVNYEEAVNSVIGKYRMIAVCTYAISRCNASEIIDVISNHQFTIFKRDGKWKLIESANCKQAKEVEEAIKKSEQKFKTIFESIPNGILILDKNRNIKEVNNVLERIFDIPREAIINKRWGDAFMCVNSAGHCEKGVEEFCRTCHVRNTIREVLAGERIYQNKTKVELALNGKVEERILLISAAPIEYENEPHAIVMLEDVTELNRLRQRLKAEHTFAGIIGRDAKMQELYDNVRELAEINVPVLINGESGTGKELVASAIHSESPRADKQFVPVNCGALPDGLLESELFGHVKGAFTGAIRDKKGRFELADGGTIFLDEVGDLSPAMQVKLLRVLQDGCFEKVGGEKTIKVDVRVVSATNKSLKDEIKSGRFREDLFYRLSVFPVNITPLRERLNDIALLSECFLRKSAEESGREVVSLSEEALSVLMDYHWPGNVRELQNALLFALVKCRGRMIEPRHLPLNIQQFKGIIPVKKSRKHKLDLQKVKDALKQTNGNRVKSAKILGVSRATMHRFLHDCKDQLHETDEGVRLTK